MTSAQRLSASLRSALPMFQVAFYNRVRYLRFKLLESWRVKIDSSRKNGISDRRKSRWNHIFMKQSSIVRVVKERQHRFGADVREYFRGLLPALLDIHERPIRSCGLAAPPASQAGWWRCACTGCHPRTCHRGGLGARHPPWRESRSTPSASIVPGVRSSSSEK
jgi:hypothetical protein